MSAGMTSLSARSAIAIQDDCRLADDLVADAITAATPRATLVTGATGFLGRYLVRELLTATDLEVVCMARASDHAHARQRVLDALARFDLAPDLLDRVHAIAGDVSDPLLGQTESQYAVLARRIDRVYHCAAEVNWARSYRRLRASNVLGGLHVLRFACRDHTKQVVLLSSIATCYATNGPDAVDETSDMTAWIDRMPLGYAQSKAVLEALGRAASARGVPVTIARPALLAGAADSGDANRDDVLAALIEGTAALGLAADVDWLMDCVPVDSVARALACLPSAAAGEALVLHLTHDRPPHWREWVLWMNLAGYPVRLAPIEEWSQRAFAERRCASTRLYGYRRFFAGGAGSDTRPFETYLAARQRSISSARTHALLLAHGLRAPVLDARLLHRYLDAYETQGLIVGSRERRRAARTVTAGACDIERLLRERWRGRDLKVTELRELPFESANGILSEIATARMGPSVGLRRYALVVRQSDLHRPLRLTTLVKTKPSDAAMEEMTVALARVCDPHLGSVLDHCAAEIGLSGGQRRELAVYRQRDPRLRRFVPRCFGGARDTRSGLQVIALEFLDDADGAELGGQLDHWQVGRTATAIRGLASIHSTWFGRVASLHTAIPLPQERTAARAAQLAPLWEALWRYASPFFEPWAGRNFTARYASLVERIGAWWPRYLALPRTLIHNDFNPRNFTLRRTCHGDRLCVFDWELAAHGAPQRDLAELLLFVADERMDRQGLITLLELHRRRLQDASGIAIEIGPWQLGFSLALAHLLVERLPMYAVVHRFRPRAFLPRLVRNWVRLDELAAELA